MPVARGARSATRCLLDAIAVGSLAFVVAGCGSGAPPHAVTPDRGGARTVRLKSQLLTLRSVGAVGPTGSARADGVGSQLVLTAMLFELGSSRASGRSLEACVRTAPGPGDVYECTLTFLLPDGAIYGQAVASARGPDQGIISGGTRTYRAVRGTFGYRGNGTPRVDLVIHLVS